VQDRILELVLGAPASPVAVLDYAGTDATDSVSIGGVRDARLHPFTGLPIGS